jgi:hypothetical protein
LISFARWLDGCEVTAEGVEVLESGATEGLGSGLVSEDGSRLCLLSSSMVETLVQWCGTLAGMY